MNNVTEIQVAMANKGDDSQVANRGDESSIKGSHHNYFKVTKYVIINVVFIVFLALATAKHIERSNCALIFLYEALVIVRIILDKSCESDCGFKFCSPYNLLLIITLVVYLGIFYLHVVKKYCSECFSGNVVEPLTDAVEKVFKAT